MPIASVNGTDLYYESHGDGFPLLCIMGLATDATAWIFQIPAFSAEYRTVVFDNRDVGRSAYASGSYRITDMAQDALALADELGLEQFHLLGLSMGGMIAQELVLAAPERVRTLTLCVTQAGAGNYGRERNRVWSERAAKMTLDERVDDLLLLTMSERFYENEELVARSREILKANANPQKPEGFARQLGAIAEHETRDRLPSVQVPTHVIGAEFDILVPVWKSKEIADLIPGADYTVIPAAPHAANAERAQEFNDAVLGWLRGK